MSTVDLRAWLATEARDLDLFAGPGGWDEGVRSLGVRPLGIEWDAAACATARAAGHLRLSANIAQLSPGHFLRDGRRPRLLIGSPPCQGFSMAGKGDGRRDAQMLIDAIDSVETAEDVDESIAYLHEHMHSDKSVLALEPLRWALYLRPCFVTLEQVPAVLPIWEATAEALRHHGYSVAVGVVSAEQYDVPQTRERAILVARDEEATEHGGPATLPAPTRSRYDRRNPANLDPMLPKWVSMAEALGAVGTMRSNYGTGGDPAARGERTADQPAPTITGKIGRNKWMPGGEREAGRWMVQNARRNATVRTDDQPAPTITGGHDHGERRWVYRNGNQAHAARRPLDAPAPTVHFAARSNKVEWMDPELAADVAASGERVTVQEAAILQTFPADYPWQGGKGKQYEQVGNAVPPTLARHIVRAALDL